MDSALKSRIAERQDILTIVVIQIMGVGIEVTAEQRVLLADLIIDAPHAGVLVVRYLPGKPDLAAVVLGSGKTMGKIQRGGREQGFIDTIDRVSIAIGTETLDRSPEDTLHPVVARFRCERREVSLQHRRCRHELRSGTVRGVLDRCLMTTEEEEFVLDDPAAQRSAKLIPLQSVPSLRCGIVRIEGIIADEFEY